MISTWKDKALFTPGPLTTSRTVKQAMLRDLGSRDSAFVSVVSEARRRLLRLASADENEFTAVLMQGSGTFGLEAVVSSVIPPAGKLLVLINGAYGERILKIAQVHRIPATPLRCAEDAVLNLDTLDAALVAEPDITHVAVVHCETTTGIINPMAAYGDVVRWHRRSYIVDAMSSFGAYPVNLDKCGIDYLISSSNKCIEGVPGFSFVLARKAGLLASRGFARTLSLDLFAQWEGLERDGQFRFTPPTHAVLAFVQALRELEAEGGVEARARRYQRNCEITLAAMEKMGFQTFLRPEHRGYIITAFRYPDHPRFDFREFYERLSAKGHVIYPGKLSHADCFRIGHIGRLEESDVHALMLAVKATLAEMDIQLSA